MKTGVQRIYKYLKELDSGFRRNDEKTRIKTFYDTTNFAFLIGTKFRMDIILSIEDVDLQECGLLVTGFFQDERPLKGTSGLIDWRLNGTISHLLKEGKMTGQWQESTLIPSRGRVIPPLILLLGLGKVRDYSTLRLRDLFPRLFETLRNLKSPKVCLSFPSDEKYNVDCGKSAEVLLEGMADCFNSGSPLDEDWATKLQLFFSVEEEKFPEILLGVQTAQSILKDRLKIRIFTASEKRSRASL